jgi:hypothetical protein
VSLSAGKASGLLPRTPIFPWHEAPEESPLSCPPHPSPAPLRARMPAPGTFHQPSRDAFETPPEPLTAEGRPRRVGIEVEFMRLGAGKAARALAAGLGGRVVGEDAHAFKVLGTAFGDLAVELDLRHAHPQRHGQVLPVRLGRRGAALLGHALGPAVPCELITEPLPLDRLPEIGRIVGILRRAGAGGPRLPLVLLPLVGTPGLHFNVDAPRLDARTLTAFLRAFVLLDPWLRRAGAGPDQGQPPTYPPCYPEDYVRRILAPGYEPGLQRFADDYLAANPTRDRGLDLLPILLLLDEARVRAKLPREKIGARPALHYRLPQAHIAEEGWTLAPDWNRWVAVERLAGDGGRLDELARAYLGFRGGREDWADRLEGMLPGPARSPELAAPPDAPRSAKG